MYHQIRQLDETANRLMQTHPEAAETIYAKQKEINEEWTQLTAKANARKEKLLDSYDLQRFLSDYRFMVFDALSDHQWKLVKHFLNWRFFR